MSRTPLHLLIPSLLASARVAEADIQELTRPVRELPHPPKAHAFWHSASATYKAPRQTPEQVQKHLDAAREKRERRAAKRRAQKERA